MNRYPNISAFQIWRSSVFFLLIAHYLARSIAVICFNRDTELTPTPSECRHILTHLPSIPQSQFDNSANFHTKTNTLDLSSPYIPHAAFRYRSCGIIFDLRKVAKQEKGLLTESKVREAWAMMREDADRVMTQCIDMGRPGIAISKVGVPVFRYQVAIEWLSADVRGQSQRQLMESRMPLIATGHGDRFWSQIYLL